MVEDGQYEEEKLAELEPGRDVPIVEFEDEWYGEGIEMEDELDEVEAVDEEEPVRVILIAVGSG